MEHLLAKEGVAGSIPVSRSFLFPGNPCKMGVPGFLIIKKFDDSLTTLSFSLICFNKGFFKDKSDV